MGLENGRLEMLFIAPDERGHGLGRQLLTLAIEKYNVTEHTVNEQKTAPLWDFTGTWGSMLTRGQRLTRRADLIR